MKGIIDRFEGNFAVIEIGVATSSVNKSFVDSAAKEGDVVTLVDGVWQVDADATAERSKHMKSLMDSVWED